MVRRVVWGQLAIDDKFQILQYWETNGRTEH